MLIRYLYLIDAMLFLAAWIIWNKKSALNRAISAILLLLFAINMLAWALMVGL